VFTQPLPRCSASRPA